MAELGGAMGFALKKYSPSIAAENLCSEYKSYFQSLNDAMNNNFVHCSGSTANGKQ